MLSLAELFLVFVPNHSQQCWGPTVVVHFSAVLRPGLLHCLKQEKQHIAAPLLYVYEME